MGLLGPLGPGGFRRRGRRRGLIVGAAVGAGIGHHMGKKAGEAEQQSQEGPVAEDPMTAQLEQLAKLHDEGVLTDEEFAAKKKQILGT